MNRKHLSLAIAALLAAGGLWFARAAWRFVDELEGDVGAREVVAAHPELVATLDAGSAVPADVDTPEDLDRLRPDM